MKPLSVEVWSDIACPWCWVGKRHLEAALAEFDQPVEVIWRAFELDASAPKTADPAVDYVERLARKYRTSTDGAQQMIDRMTGVGRDNGLDFRFDRAQAGNTFDAHRLLAWAATQGKQSELKERLFQAYMHEGKSVSDLDVLVELAADVGLDAERAQAQLSGDDWAQEVRDDEARAAEIGVTGVPFFAIAGRYAVQGAQPADVLASVLRRAQADLGADDAGADDAGAEIESGEVCGPDGCAV